MQVFLDLYHLTTALEFCSSFLSTQILEESEIEDLGRLDRQNHELVATELVAELVVRDLDRIAVAQPVLEGCIQDHQGHAFAEKVLQSADFDR